jgi:Domain of unknown function (DUF4214)
MPQAAKAVRGKARGVRVRPGSCLLGQGGRAWRVALLAASLALPLGVAVTALGTQPAGASTTFTETPCTGDIATQAQVNQLITDVGAANNDNDGDTIVLPAGCTYTLDATNDITGLETGLYGSSYFPAITGTFSIEGNGATITDDDSAARFFEIDPTGHLTVNDVTFAGGDDGSNDFGTGGSGFGGGAMYNAGTLTVQGGAFTYNQTSSNGGAIDNADGTSGGAGTGTLTVEEDSSGAGTTFFNDGSEVDGGAIDNADHGSGNATVDGATFTQDTSNQRQGGAIDNADNEGSGNLYVNFDPSTHRGTGTESTFSEDGAFEGGAISNADGNHCLSPYCVVGDPDGSGNAFVYDSTFSNNRSYAANGGAIDNYDGNDSGTGSDLTAVDDTFSGNSAGNSGGAIDNADDGGVSSATITGSTFTDNDAANDDGGAIDTSDDGGSGNTVVSDSTFTGNTASGAGGGIDTSDNDGTGNLTMVNTTMEDNGSPDIGDNIAEGIFGNGDSEAGIAVVLDSTLIDDSSFQQGDIVAGDGGGGGQAFLAGDIVAAPGTDDGTCFGSDVTDLAYNLFSDGECLSRGTSSVDPAFDTAMSSELAAPANNGGPADTMALVSGGQAIAFAIPVSTAIDGPDIATHGTASINLCSGTYDTIALSASENRAARARMSTCNVGAYDVPATVPTTFTETSCADDTATQDQVNQLISDVGAANLDNEDDTIVLPAGCTYTLDATNDTAGLVTGAYGSNYFPVVTGTFSIEGNGATITDDDGAARFFEIDPTGNLNVEDVTFTGGEDGSISEGGGSGFGGGAIYNAGTLTVEGGAFTDDQTTSNGGAIDSADGISGGAGTGTLTVEEDSSGVGTTFSNDGSDNDGGAINNADDGSGNATVDGATFSDDYSIDWQGGAIDNADDGGTGNLYVNYDPGTGHGTGTESTFSGDSAWEGGAITNADGYDCHRGYCDGGDSDGIGEAFVYDSTFSGDFSFAANGGAIDNDDGDDNGSGSDLTAVDDTFSGNSAGNSGGAIDNADDGGNGNTVVSDSAFIGNTACCDSPGDGGAIDTSDNGGSGNLTLVNTTMEDNRAHYEGDSIDVGDYGTGGAGIAVVLDSTLVDDSGGSGGDITAGDDNGGGAAFLAGDIVAVPGSAEGTCYGTDVIDLGYNLFSDNSTRDIGCWTASTSALDTALDTATSSELAAPANNGGPADTMALVSGGQAIAFAMPTSTDVSVPDIANSGSVSINLCSGTYDTIALNPAENGAARNAGASCNAGAFEGPAAATSTPPTPAPPPPGTSGSDITALITSTVSASGPTDVSASSGGASSDVTIPAGALPGGTTVTEYSVDTADFIPPAGSSYILGFGVSWQAPDGTTPAASTPITMTIMDPSIAVGDVIYQVASDGSLVEVGTATQAGQVTITFEQDPSFLVATPAATPPATPAPTQPPPPPSVPPTTPTSACASDSGNDAFICAAYEDLFHRVPDAGGLSTYAGLLAKGASRAEVAHDLVTSAEYRADLVNGYYEAYLGRPADAAGLATYLGQLEHGASDQAVQAALLGSAEFYAKAGSSPAGFIDSAYEDLFGRSPDPGGLALWEAALASGVSRTAVAADLLASTEYRTDLVGSYYERFLGRAADPGGMLTALRALASGATDGQVIAGFIGSPEFYAVATSG